MLKKLSWMMALLLTVSLVGCGSDDDEPGGGSGGGSTANTVSISTSSVSLEGSGSSQTLTLTTNHEWGASIADSWIHLDVSSGMSGSFTITVSADVNPSTSPRTGSVLFMAGTARATLTVTQSGGETDIYPAPAGYELVWHDEFDSGTELSSEWVHEVQGKGWVNNELQNYVNHVSPEGAYVTHISNGKLHINCFKENGKIYSGRVYAKPSVGWTYGYFEAKIKLPTGKGTWPAFWMMPVVYTGWPGCGEIDIMEEVGVDAGWVSSSIHCNAYNHPKNTQKTHAMYVSTAESDYHVYAVEWTSTKLRFTVDGEEQLVFENDMTGNHDTWPFNVAFYPILNLAWGGDWGGYAGVDESKLPVTMDVEYVRVFQKK